MQLDVVIPTYNRAPLLARALDSLDAADRPPGLDVAVTVVDNASTDDTRALVEARAARAGGRLRYVHEARPGRSHALNAGIAATHGALVGMIDDDEEVDRTWLTVIARAFADPTLDFIGGPYAPRWGAPPPPWLPPRPSSIIGWVQVGDEPRDFGDPSFDAMLMGGNAVIRRALLERVGPYATNLGRTGGKTLLSGEDHDMYLRLLRAGGRGRYLPDLIIHHFIPPERLEKGYHRRWTFWHAVSMTRMRDLPDEAHLPRWFGVPRVIWGSALRGAVQNAAGLARLGGARAPWERFDRSLRWWALAGRLYGKVRRA